MTENEIKLEVLKKVFNEVFGERINFIDVKTRKEQMYAAELEKRAEAEEKEGGKNG